MSRDNTVITNNENKSNNFEDMRNKQIEEMACEKCIHLEECKRIFRRAKDNGMWEHTTEEQYFSESACDCQFYADKNIYRKSTEVAREVIEDCITILNTEYRKCSTNDVKIILAMIRALAELKKKYTEGGE